MVSQGIGLSVRMPGRGDRGGIQPCSIEREVPAIDALVAESSGAAAVYGCSSGAVLAVEAVVRNDAIQGGFAGDDQLSLRLIPLGRCPNQRGVRGLSSATQADDRG